MRRLAQLDFTANKTMSDPVEVRLNLGRDHRGEPGDACVCLCSFCGEGLSLCQLGLCAEDGLCVC